MGTAGHGGGGGTTAICAQLAVDYGQAFLRARMCNLAVSAAQCAHLVTASLTCGCQAWVNDTTELDTIRALWTATGCPAQVCPGAACVSPGTSAACLPIDSGDVCSARN